MRRAWLGRRRDTLEALALATDLLREAKVGHEALIERAIAEGHSERSIAKAAGISGPAIHQRKKKHDSPSCAASNQEVQR